MKLLIIDPSTDPRWDSFVERHPLGTLYHRSCWKEILQRTFGYAPLYCVLEDAERNIVGGMALAFVRSVLTGNRLVSLPFADYCDPLVGSEEDFRALLSGIVQSVQGRKSRFIKLCTADPPIALPAFGFQQAVTYKNHLVPTDRPLDQIRSSVISTSRRNMIRKAQKLGVRVVRADNEGDLEEFLLMYLRTRKGHGLLPMPFRFFRNLWKEFSPKGQAYLHVAKLGPRSIAGMFLLRDSKMLYALSAASIEEYLSYRPNDLLYWEAIELASREGLPFVDFGRTAEGNHGLLQFKREWGSTERDLRHYLMPLKGHRHWRMEGLASHDGLRRLVKRMPDPLLKIGGDVLYRHLG